MTSLKRNRYISLLVSAAILLPASTFAMTESATPVQTSATVSSVQICLKPLFEKRETAIMSAWDAEYTDIKKAMETRKSAISEALTMTDIKQARKAIATAHKSFRDAVQKARSTSRESRRLAWEAFKTDTSSCGKKGATTLESPSTSSATTDVQAE